MRASWCYAWVGATLVVGCGGKAAPREVEEAEPAWAARYLELVEAACACGDDACVRAADARAAKYLAARGGIEAAPPSVHEHRTRLQGCFLERSEDLPRDVEGAAERICGCTSTDCVVDWRKALDALAAKYRAADVEALGASIDRDEQARGAWRRANACLAKVTLPGQTYLQLIEENTAELCACATRDCAEAAQARIDAKLEGILTVSIAPEQDAPIQAAKLARCKCEKRFPPRRKLDVELQIGGIPARLEGDLYVKIECVE